MIEYHVKFRKKISPNDQHWACTKLALSLRHAMKIYHDQIAWNARVPAIELQDLRIIKRTVIEEDITPYAE